MPTGTEDALERILRCGDPNYGLTLFHCPDCKVHMAVPFSCKQRICPSCSNRRAEDVSDRLLEQLPQVTYRHVVVTLPMKMGLRKRLQQDPRLYRHVSRLLHRLFCRWLPGQVSCHRNRREEKEKALPGIIMAVQTFGMGLRQHPHFHCLVTDGVFFPDGQFWPLGSWNTGELCEQVRASVLQSLVARQCLSEESAVHVDPRRNLSPRRARVGGEQSSAPETAAHERKSGRRRTTKTSARGYFEPTGTRPEPGHTPNADACAPPAPGITWEMSGSEP